MCNELKYTVEMKRINVLDLMMAVNHVIFAFEDEIKDPETTEERRKICQNSIEHRWMPVKKELEKQFDAQDKAHGFA